MHKYKYNKQAGALQEAPASSIGVQRARLPAPEGNQSDALVQLKYSPDPFGLPEPDTSVNDNGLDPHQQHLGRTSMFSITIEEGQQVLVTEKNGRMLIIEGPKRVRRKGRRFQPMKHYVAHPGDFLIVRFRDGTQQHLVGPTHVWFDPRVHKEITKEEALPIADKEAVVVYSEDGDQGAITRRIVHGPDTFVPKPGEWLHTFSWHGSAPSAQGYKKVPNALVFQKLWLLPDQMYHDVTDVRTADDAVLTIRLMLFFELRDIDKMLSTTHDPIGDCINAATSDVIEFVSRHDFEAFKQNTEKLNDLATYKQLTTRAQQCGYATTKVVYRGYGAPEKLQLMHDQAIESRTRLQLERATEQQAQELEDFKLERTMARESTIRQDAAARQTHQLELSTRALEAEIHDARTRRKFEREQDYVDAEATRQQHIADKEALRIHLAGLAELGVDLTALLTQHRADQVIELRSDPTALDSATPHLHLESK